MQITGNNNGNRLSHYGIYVGVSLAVLAFFGILTLINREPFQPYFGTIHPLLVASLSVILGLLLLRIHLTNNWLRIYRRENRSGLAVAPAFALVFGIVIIMVDLASPFPADINVTFPLSLLFYPAIGFVVEILFHLLPVTLLLWLILNIAKNRGFKDVIWPVILLLALLEPTYQLLLGFSGGAPGWTETYVALHIFLINLTQLWLFKRFDFMSMYLFRVVYYLVWHIVWGVLRLELL